MASKGKGSSIASALSKLRKEREGKSTVLDEYEVEDENDQIYEIITEEEFNERNKRRKLEDFIEGADFTDDEFDDFEDDLEDLEENVDRLPKKSSKLMAPGKSIQQHFIEMAAQDSLTYQPPKATETDKALMERLSKFEDELDNETSSLPTNPVMAAANPFMSSQMFNVPNFLSQTLMQATTETHHVYNTRHTSSDNPELNKDFSSELMGDYENHFQNAETLSETSLDPSIMENFREIESLEPEGPETTTVESEQTGHDMKLDEKLNEDIAFYLLDLCEGPSGYLHLFGRIWTGGTETETCMITVKNFHRVLFFKPRSNLMFNETGELTNVVDDGTITREDPLYERHLMMNFFKEMESVKKVYGIKKIMYKLVKRSLLKYGPTKEDLFIKVCYSFQYPALERHHHQGTFYEDIYNMNATQTELFLLKRKIKGPNWLRIKNWKKIEDKMSHCKVELEIDSYKDVELWFTKENEELFIPKFITLSISIKTIFNVPTQQEVFIICCIHNKYNFDDNEIKDTNHQFVGIRRPQGYQWPEMMKEFVAKRPYFRMFEQERGLLSSFMSFLQEADPDFVVGHDIHQNVIDVLIKRCNMLNIPFRVSLSRLKIVKRSNTPFLFGRLYCDTRLLIRELHPSRENYNLISCVNEFLKVKYVTDLNYYNRTSFNVNEIKKILSNETYSLKNLLKLVESNHVATKHILQLLFKLQILPLTKELTMTAGNTWSRSLQCARSERIDYLLMHEFYRNKYILDHSFEKNMYKDNYQDDDKNEGKKGSSYEGGLVFEPISGLYDNFILLLDFNSLYPSIIQEYNICFTTTYVSNQGGGSSPSGVDRMETDNMNEDNEEDTMERKEEVVILDNIGILPSILKRLVELRSNIKTIIAGEKNELRKSQLKTRQLALKLIANSIYGCIGSTFSRFNCKYIASYITQQGRNLLKSTKEKVENVFNLQVIYGDTDSLMINTNIRDDGNLTNYNAANQLAHNLTSFVNKSHKKLEIGIDGIFNRLLLLKKKKYAALKVVDYEQNVFNREIKGLDFIRRDWSLLTKEVGNHLLNIILNSNYFNGVDGIVQEIHSTLQNLNQQLNDQSIELSKFVITKQLTKNPREYSDVQNLPHVSVALRLNEKGTANYTTGHEVSYIVCTKESSKTYYNKVNRKEDDKNNMDKDGKYNNNDNNYNKDVDNGENEENKSKERENENDRNLKNEKENKEKTKYDNLRNERSENKKYEKYENKERNRFNSGDMRKEAYREDNISFRAFHINEIKEHDLKVDVHYYKTQQLLPPILRLCSIIDGTDIQRLSKCLQVETMYGHVGVNSNQNNYEQECKVLSLIKRSPENYKEVEMHTRLTCQYCNGLVLPNFFLKYFKCNHCLKWLPLQLLRNWVDRALYEITLQSSFCIRICNICNVTTLNVSLGNIDRCPQPTCQSNDSMQNILSSNKVYLYYDYLVYMLEGDLQDPEQAELENEIKFNSINSNMNTNNNTSNNNTTIKSEVNGNKENKDVKNERNENDGNKNKSNTLVNVIMDYNGKMTILYDEPYKEPKTLDDIIEQITRENTLRATSGLRLCAEHIIGVMESLPFLKYYTLDYKREREILCNRVKTLQQKNAYSIVNLSDLFKVFKLDNRNAPHTF